MLSTSGMKETQQREINLEEDPKHASGFEVFLAYIYPCSTTEVNSSNCVSGKLVNECEAFLLEEGRTSRELLLLAQRYGLKKTMKQKQVEWACCNPDTSVHFRWDEINPETCRLFLHASNNELNCIHSHLSITTDHPPPRGGLLNGQTLPTMFIPNLFAKKSFKNLSFGSCQSHRPATATFEQAQHEQEKVLKTPVPTCSRWRKTVASLGTI
ncbi:hypothetical protein QOT17_012398 [Balamuthia mandrillaris]